MKNMIKRIIIGIIIGLVLMACRKYLFVSASALSTDGVDIRTPNWTTVSNYSGQTIRVWAGDMFPNESTWSLSYVKNKFVYISFCTDMPSLGYGKDSFYNSTNGLTASAVEMKLAGNLTNKTCTFSNGYQGKVMYIKFKLVNNILNTGNSDYTYPVEGGGYVSFWIASSGQYSITAQSVAVMDDDFDIYSNDIDIDGMIAAQNVTNQAINNTTNAVNNNTNAINNMNNSIKDESSPDVEDDLFDGITTDDESNSPVSDLILLPLTLLNAYVDGFSSSCSAFDLGTLYGHNLVLPCIDIDDYIGSNLWSLIDVICSIFLIYNVGMMCVSMYESITSLEDGFRGLYTPRHADTGYKPRHGGDD